MKATRLLALLLAGVLTVPVLSGCSNGGETDGGDTDVKLNEVGTVYADKSYGFQLEKPSEGDTIAIMHTSLGDISLRLFPEAAPKAVENFTTHAKNGYYDGLTFHRVMEDFMIQGGDPKGTGTGGESIWGGSFEDEFDQKLLNLRGALSMANSGVDTNGSQFFINQAPASAFAGKEKYVSQEESYTSEDFQAQCSVYYRQNESQLKQDYKSWTDYYQAILLQLAPVASMVPDEVWTLYEQNGGNIHLDGAWRSSGGHTVFGQVFEGMEVVDAIAAVETDDNNKPLESVIINSIEITEYAG